MRHDISTFLAGSARFNELENMTVLLKMYIIYRVERKRGDSARFTFFLTYLAIPIAIDV